jgi:hypothetical protein
MLSSIQLYPNEVLTTLCSSGSAEEEKSPEFFLQPSKSILWEKDV